MYDINNPIPLDTNKVFFDNRNIFYFHRDIKEEKSSNIKNLWIYDTENSSLNSKVNFFSINTFNINIFVGFSSKLSFNNILNSSFYKKNINISENVFSPFVESEEYKGKKASFGLNPYIFKKTLGQENPDELFEKIENEPFHDIDNIEDTASFFSMPTEIKYPRYFNHYSLSRLNSNISVFGTIEEIDGSMLTEKPLQGMKCDLIKNSTDARNRSINFSESISLQEMSIDENGNNKYKIESYSDEEYTDLVTGDDDLLKRSFKYSTKIINGKSITVLDTSENSFSLSARLTNKVIFYSEDDNNIPPFIDRNIIPQSQNDSNHTANNVYNTGNSFPSHGHDNDKSNGSGPDSAMFTGELD